MINVYLSGNPVHDRVLKAFYEGAEGEKKLIQGFKYEPSDVAVVFGVHKSRIRQSWPRGKVISQQRAKNLDVVVLETGYINRGDGENHHYAAGFNGLNGRADFRNKNMPAERWQKLGIKLNHFKRGDKILLCGQVPWDASVEGSDHLAWLEETAWALKLKTQKPVIFRPHPLADLKPMKGCEHSRRHLAEDLKEAHAVVTFNSNTGVDALLAGKPVFTADHGSMVWSVSGHDIKDIDEPKYPPDRDLAQWAFDLAYTQWTPEEMRKGLAWQHLFR